MGSNSGVLMGKRVGLVHSFAPLFASGVVGLLAMTAATPGKAAMVIQTFTQTDTFTGFAASSSGTTYSFPLAAFSA
jgi:hypothetical protein